MTVGTESNSDICRPGKETGLESTIPQRSRRKALTMHDQHESTLKPSYNLSMYCGV